MRSPLAAGAALAIVATGFAIGAAPFIGTGMRGADAGAQPLGVTVGTLGAIGSLDPRHGDSEVAREVWSLQYPTLTGLDPKTLAPVPGLASGWVPTRNGRGWVYTLRKGLAWSDGRPVTAADVVFSFERARDEHWPYAGSLLAGLKARATDDRTVEVTATRGRTPPAGLPLHVVPQHVFASAADISRDLAKLGVADGTWRVVSATPDSVELDADAASGPAVKRITFRTYPNADALIAALAHKQVDAVSGLPVAAVDRLENLPNVTVDHASDGTKYVLRVGPTHDTAVQRAISLAIDRIGLVADAVHGVGTAATADAQPDTAKTDLRALASSTDATPLTIAVPTDATSRRVGDLVREDLAAVGVHTRVVEATATDPDLSLERIAAGAGTARTIDLFEPDVLQAYRSDHVTGWLPDPQRRKLVVFGPTVVQYGALTAAKPPASETAGNGAYAVGAVIVLALCAALYWVASRFRRRYVPTEEPDVS